MWRCCSIINIRLLMASHNKWDWVKWMSLSLNDLNLYIFKVVTTFFIAGWCEYNSGVWSQLWYWPVTWSQLAAVMALILCWGWLLPPSRGSTFLDIRVYSHSYKQYNLGDTPCFNLHCWTSYFLWLNTVNHEPQFSYYTITTHTFFTRKLREKDFELNSLLKYKFVK